jgi:hypothetical protein
MISVRWGMWADWKQSVETCMLITDLQQTRSLEASVNNPTLQQKDTRSWRFIGQWKRELLSCAPAQINPLQETDEKLIFRFVHNPLNFHLYQPIRCKIGMGPYDSWKKFMLPSEQTNILPIQINHIWIKDFENCLNFSHSLVISGSQQ